MENDTEDRGAAAKKDRTGKEPGRPKDPLVRFVVPTMVTLVLGVATFWMDSRISERAEKEQAARLYTQLISDREQASTALRKDMFGTILGQILGAGGGAATVVGSRNLDNQLLKLELLALNFGESLSMGPLFATLDRQIRTDASYATKLERLDRSAFDARLSSLARRVADAQRGSLAGEAKSFVVDVPRAQVGEVGSFSWPDTPRNERLACLVLDNIQRRVELTFENVDQRAKTIDVSLALSTHKLAPEAPGGCHDAFGECAELEGVCVKYLFTHYREPTKPFTIDRFNLPLIDNSLLSDDQRFALIMRDFTDEYVEVLGILYPGQYAGRQDKLTLDQAIEALQGRIQ